MDRTFSVTFRLPDKPKKPVKPHKTYRSPILLARGYSEMIKSGKALKLILQGNWEYPGQE